MHCLPEIDCKQHIPIGANDGSGKPEKAFCHMKNSKRTFLNKSDSYRAASCDIKRNNRMYILCIVYQKSTVKNTFQ